MSATISTQAPFAEEDRAATIRFRGAILKEKNLAQVVQQHAYNELGFWHREAYIVVRIDTRVLGVAGNVHMGTPSVDYRDTFVSSVEELEARRKSNPTTLDHMPLIRLAAEYRYVESKIFIPPDLYPHDWPNRLADELKQQVEWYVQHLPA